MLEPNFSKASSAASSAFSMSFSRFVASERKREIRVSASLTMSAGRDSGLSGWGSADASACLELEASLSAELVSVVEALGVVWLIDRARVRLRRVDWSSLRPFVAVLLAAPSSFWASS